LLRFIVWISRLLGWAKNSGYYERSITGFMKLHDQQALVKDQATGVAVGSFERIDDIKGGSSKCQAPVPVRLR
jgi:hypothetical protein